MSLQLIHSGKEYLRIGDFVISCLSRTTLGGEEFLLPNSFSAFEYTGKEPETFRFIVDEDFVDEHIEEIYKAENYMRNQVFRRNDNGLDWIWYKNDGTPGVKIHILDNWSTMILSHCSTYPQKLNSQVGTLFNYAMLAHDAFVLHGVAMEYEGKGIIISARSGTGKTTHARMWRDNEGALILNGDRSLCRKINGRWYVYGMPWCGSSGEYINRKIPITCIVQLRRGDQNEVHRVPPFEASISLMERIMAPVWDQRLREKAIDVCGEIGVSIPVLHLSCRPEIEAVNVLKKAVSSL